jgi:hypothetical protein
MNPFTEYKVYGPTYHKRIDRMQINLVSPTHRTSMTYARYLMCIKEGRWLETDEEVDHIDGNRHNDNIDNLQILSRAENRAKYNATRQKIIITKTCEWCGIEFSRRAGNIKKTCSRSCGGKLSHITKNKGQ